MSSQINNTTATGLRPEHHVHQSSDPLPGSRGINAIDYSADTMEQTPSTWDQNQEQKFSAAQGLQSQPDSGRNAFNSDRPLNVEPTPAGGVAIGGDADLPEGHASTMDKLVGKTQKVVGKYAHKPELHEKGELRESGGKAAVTGDARAPHD